jgi:hypothetical protein
MRLVSCAWPGRVGAAIARATRAIAHATRRFDVRSALARYRAAGRQPGAVPVQSLACIVPSPYLHQHGLSESVRSCRAIACRAGRVGCHTRARGRGGSGVRWLSFPRRRMVGRCKVSVPSDRAGVAKGAGWANWSSRAWPWQGFGLWFVRASGVGEPERLGSPCLQGEPKGGGEKFCLFSNTPP